MFSVIGKRAVLSAIFSLLAGIAVGGIGIERPDMLRQYQAQHDGTQLAIYVAPFGGADNFSANIGTVELLSVWRTMMLPRPTDGPGAIRDAFLYWPTSSSPIVTSPQAAAGQGYPLVLWGLAHRYGDGFIVDSYLSTVSGFRARWDVRFKGRSISLGLPRAVFELGPVDMTDDLVEFYSSPAALRVCPTPVMPCDGKPVGKGLTALAQTPNWSLVRTDAGDKGYIYLPNEFSEKGTAPAFAGGMIAYYRGEFDYAARLFSRVSKIDTAPTELRSDAAAMANCSEARLRAEMQDGPWADEPQTPLSSSFDVQVAVMSELDVASRTINVTKQVHSLQEAGKLLDENAALFEPDDPWFLRARQMSAG
jgi:hypothetical protein